MRPLNAYLQAYSPLNYLTNVELSSRDSMTTAATTQPRAIAKVIAKIVIHMAHLHAWNVPTRLCGFGSFSAAYFSSSRSRSRLSSLSSSCDKSCGTS